MKYQILPYVNFRSGYTLCSSSTYMGDPRILYLIYRDLFHLYTLGRDFLKVSFRFRAGIKRSFTIRWRIYAHPSCKPVDGFEIYELQTPNTLDFADVNTYMRGLSLWLRNSN